MSSADIDQPAEPNPSGLAASGVNALLGDLDASARRDRAALIDWLIDRGFTTDQIAASVAPMLLPANRVMGDDGNYVSTREVAKSAGIELQVLQRLQRAVGLPQIEDPDAAVLPKADADAAARTKFFVDFGVDTDDAVAVVRVLMHGLRKTAAMMRETAYGVLITPGATEIEVARTAEALAERAVPLIGPMVEGLLRLELRHLFEEEGISAAERAGELPGARQVAVAFADIVGFTRLGEALPPEELVGLVSRLSELAHDLVTPPVRYIKTIGDAVMIVSPDPVRLVETALQLVDLAAANGLAQLRAGVASGSAVSLAGDWFGSPVNLASRVTGIAKPGTVLVAQSTREAIGATGDFAWSSAGAHHLKGVSERVELFAARHHRR